MARLSGKTALITGASEGIGRATAEAFVRESATVFITGRRPQVLEETAKAIGRTVVPIQADSAKLADIDRIARELDAAGKRLDVLFVNAGFLARSLLGEITEEAFDQLVGANFKGVVFTVQKMLPLFNDGGAIILTGSTAAQKGRGMTSVYAATKAAVRSPARTWAVDLKDRQIRVNVISPSIIETPGLSTALRQRTSSTHGSLPRHRSAAPGDPRKSRQSRRFSPPRRQASSMAPISRSMEGGHRSSTWCGAAYGAVRNARSART